MSGAESYSFRPFPAGNGPADGSPATGSAQLSFEPRLGCICTAFSGKIREHTFREMQEQALLLRQGYGTCRLLIDLSGLQMLDSAVQHWLVREWLPRAVASGYEVLALVLPGSPAALLSAHQMGQAARLAGMRVQTFPTVTLAGGWLGKQPGRRSTPGR
jgi:hypothetical protein